MWIWLLLGVAIIGGAVYVVFFRRNKSGNSIKGGGGSGGSTGTTGNQREM